MTGPEGGSQDKHKTRHELKRLARNAAGLMGLSAALEAGGIQLELLTGPLTGVYDPNGMGAMLFAVLAVAAQLDREYIREKTLEGQQAAAAKGNHGGRPKVIDDDMLTFARALKDKGTPDPGDREEAEHQDRQQRRQTPLRRIPLPAPWQKPTRSTPRHAPDQAPSVQDQLMAGFVLTLAVPQQGPQMAFLARSADRYEA
jgi:Resolvase, N terminal domain